MEQRRAEVGAVNSVALLGTGTMGAGMAGRLLGAGYSLTVWNRNPERAASLVERGARLALSPADAATSAEVVIVMVADDEASRSVWLGDSGALGAAQRGAIMIDSSTLSPTWVAELASAARAHACEFLDAPVTGSRPQAESGELTFLVGGEESVLGRVRDVLASMSRAIVHVGPVGSGALLKLVNNFVCGVQVAALAEALALMERSGLVVERALPVLQHGAPGSPLFKLVSQRMVDRDPTLNFSVDLMKKDLAYAVAVGEGFGIALETAVTAQRAFQRAQDLGLGPNDVSAVVETLRS
jgi:3-hydroxyisobutyrate dehydrogenase